MFGRYWNVYQYHYTVRHANGILFSRFLIISFYSFEDVLIFLPSHFADKSVLYGDNAVNCNRHRRHACTTKTTPLVSACGACINHDENNDNPNAPPRANDALIYYNCAGSRGVACTVFYIIRNLVESKKRKKKQTKSRRSFATSRRSLAADIVLRLAHNCRRCSKIDHKRWLIKIYSFSDFFKSSKNNKDEKHI